MDVVVLETGLVGKAGCHKCSHPWLRSSPPSATTTWTAWESRNRLGEGGILRMEPQWCWAIRVLRQWLSLGGQAKAPIPLAEWDGQPMGWDLTGARASDFQEPFAISLLGIIS